MFVRRIYDLAPALCLGMWEWEWLVESERFAKCSVFAEKHAALKNYASEFLMSDKRKTWVYA